MSPTERNVLIIEILGWQLQAANNARYAASAYSRGAFKRASAFQVSAFRNANRARDQYEYVYGNIHPE